MHLLGELASLALEDLANSASNFMTSWSAYKKFKQSDKSRYDNGPQPIEQWERDAVIRKTVAKTAATVTGYLGEYCLTIKF